MSIKVYVEGGGDSNQLRRQCRNGFREFFEKAGLKGRMPRVVACGSRRRAYDQFCAAINEADTGNFIVLLVDSEDAVTSGDSPWEHLRKRDNWTQPSAATDDSAQLMVQCMEAWFVADRQSLSDYFGKDFKAAALPARDVEAIAKDDFEPMLRQATKSCSKGSYNKGRHSFELLGCLDPSKVMNSSCHARRLIDTLRQS
jgi:hypothetical protein